jgi:hypothetical protein
MMEPTEEQYREWSMKAQWSTDLARMAYQAGADAELEACCEWIEALPFDAAINEDSLREVRRPKSQPANESAEQQARDLLDRMGVPDAQSFSAGDLVELANLIAMRPKPPGLKQQALSELQAVIDYSRDNGVAIYTGRILRAIESLPDE